MPWEGFTKSTRVHWEKENMLCPHCFVIVLFSRGTILTPSASSWQQLTRQTPKWCVLSTTGADSVELWNATFFFVILKGCKTAFSLSEKRFKNVPSGTKGSRTSYYWALRWFNYWIACLDISKALVRKRNIPFVTEQFATPETTKGQCSTQIGSALPIVLDNSSLTIFRTILSLHNTFDFSHPKLKCN